jgi:hypothetical protein
MERVSLSREGSHRPPAHWARVCYGVDCRADGIVVVRAERRGRRLHSAVLPPDRWPAAARAERAVTAASLSARESFAHWIETPFASLAKTRRVLPTLLDIRLPFALEDCVFCFLAAASSRTATRALAVAARQSAVEARLKSLADAGADPLILDQEGLALWTESLREAPPAPGAAAGTPRIVVWLSADAATLVVGAGMKFLGAHGVNPDDAGQVNRVLRNHFPERLPAVEWYWAGPGAEDPARVAGLRARLAADWPGPSTTHEQPNAFLARALAARALLPGPLRCNLRSGPFAHGALDQRLASLSARAAALFLLAGVLLAGSGFAWSAALNRREADLDRAFLSLRNDLAGYDAGPAKGEYALRIVRERLAGQKALFGPFARAFEASRLTVLGEMLRMAAGNDLRFEMLSVDDGKASASGTAGNWRQCEQLARSLRERGFEVRLERKPAPEGGRIPFQIVPGNEDG